MTPEETQLLFSEAQWMHFDVVFLTTNAIFWAIHFTLSIAAIISLCQRSQGFRSTSSGFLIIIMTALVTLNTYRVADKLKDLLLTLDDVFTKNLDSPLLDRVNADNQRLMNEGSQFVYLFITNSPGLLTLTGDLVILWRGWKIWMRSKLYMLVPAFFLVASLAFSIATNTPEVQAQAGQVTSNTTLVAITGFTGIACNIAANAITTAMIGFQALEHRNMMKAVLGHEKFRSWRVLLYLTESGVAYLVVQVVALILNILTVTPLSPMHYAGQNFESFTLYLSTTYPAIVVLMVSAHRSLENDGGISGQLSDLDTHMSFVRDPVLKEATQDSIFTAVTASKSFMPHQLDDRQAVKETSLDKLRDDEENRVGI